MEEPYCVLCQDGHKMSELCVTNNVQCKDCGEKGHVRRDCPGLRFNTKSISAEQRKQIIHECVEGKISPTLLGKKWKCNPDTIRTWVRKAGLQLPKQYKKVNHNYEPGSPNTSDTDNDDGDIATSDGQDKDDSIASRLRKRKGSNEDSSFANRDSVSNKLGSKRKRSNQSSDLPHKSIKLMTGPVCKTEEPEKAPIFQPAQPQVYQAAAQHSLPATSTPLLETLEVPIVESNVDSVVISLDTTDEECVTNDNADSDKNGNVILISDSDDEEGDRKIDSKDASCNGSTMLMDYSEMMENEQDYPEPAKNDSQREEYYENKEILKSSDEPRKQGQNEECYKNKEILKSSVLPIIEGQIEEYFESKENLKPSIKVLNNQDKKSPNLKAGSYNIVSVHLELFRSSKSSSIKLTQIGCVVSGVSSGVFFKAIKPDGIEEYLDHYKLGGDLMQALHMTREDDGTFLFRSRFEVTEEAEKITCSGETEALVSFLDFLQNYPNCIIVGVDEDTLAILVGKLKNVSVEKFRIISGFTYWKRVLKYLDVDGYKGIDLEEYHTYIVGEDLPSFTTALSIASVVMASVREVASKEKGGRKSVDSGFYKLCKRIEHIQHPIKFEYDDTATVENVEVYSSFRPSVSATISAEKLEQIILSDSDSEPEALWECQAGERAFVAATNDVVYDDTETAENVEVCSSFRPSVQPTRIQPFRLQPTIAQSPIVQPPTVQPSRRQPNNVWSSAVQPSTVQQSRLWLKASTSWILGDPTPNGGTVLCPQCMARVRYSKISAHIFKVHPNMHHITGARLCPVCHKNVFPSQVASHMPGCSPAPACAQPTQQLLRGTKPAGSNSVSTAEPPARSASHPCRSTDFNPSVLLRIVLDSYLVQNFEPFPAGKMMCLWIYKDYQKTMMAQGHREMLSFDKFVVAVVEGAMMNWNINATSAGIDQGSLLKRMDSRHLYFQGFRKKCDD